MIEFKCMQAGCGNKPIKLAMCATSHDSCSLENRPYICGKCNIQLVGYTTVGMLDEF